MSVFSYQLGSVAPDVHLLEDVSTNAPEEQGTVETKEDCHRGDSVVKHRPLFYYVVGRGYTWQDLRKKKTVAYPDDKVADRCNDKDSMENSD